MGGGRRSRRHILWIYPVRDKGALQKRVPRGRQGKRKDVYEEYGRRNGGDNNADKR